jgi:hypothetical protein
VSIAEGGDEARKGSGIFGVADSRVPVVTTVALVVSLARGDESVGGSMSWRRRRRR